MTIHLRLPALAAFALIGLVAPAMAAPAVPADANAALWCATAFTQVEPQARSAGQTEMADNFLKYGKGLITGLMLQWQDGKQSAVWPKDVAKVDVKFPSFIKLSN